MWTSLRTSNAVRFYMVIITVTYAIGAGDPMGAQLRILHDLLDGYDDRIRPMGFDQNTNETSMEAVLVTVNVYLRTISKVDDVNMEYSVHFTFREEWLDDRLKFSADQYNISRLVLPSNTTIWMPDTFFQNEKDGKFHTIDKPNIMLRVQSTGQILYSVRYTLTMSCPMDLRAYPLDTQECYIDLASYAYTTDDIVYQWKKTAPFQIKPGLHKSLPSFILTSVSTAMCTSVTNTGTYSCLRLILKLKREFSYYLLQLYIPSFMLVGVSWVSFWLDKDSVPARVTLGVTTLLTMTTQASGINAKLPPVSYTKAIDVWIGVCLAFIFGALLEFALVNYAARRDMLEKLNTATNHVNVTENATYELDDVHIEVNEHPQLSPIIFERRQSWSFDTPKRPIPVDLDRIPRCRPLNGTRTHRKHPGPKGLRRRKPFRPCCKGQLSTRAKKIDFFSRIIFPIAFGFFNVVYWLFYLLPYMNSENR